MVIFSFFSVALTTSGSPSNPQGNMIPQVERYFPCGVKLGSEFVWKRAQMGISMPRILPFDVGEGIVGDEVKAQTGAVLYRITVCHEFFGKEALIRKIKEQG